MSTDDTDATARTRMAQHLTCPCCMLTWASSEILKANLELMLKGIKKKLASMGVAS